MTDASGRKGYAHVGLHNSNAVPEIPEYEFYINNVMLVFKIILH